MLLYQAASFLFALYPTVNIFSLAIFIKSDKKDLNDPIEIQFSQGCS